MRVLSTGFCRALRVSPRTYTCNKNYPPPHPLPSNRGNFIPHTFIAGLVGLVYVLNSRRVLNLFGMRSYGTDCLSFFALFILPNIFVFLCLLSGATKYPSSAQQRTYQGDHWAHARPACWYVFKYHVFVIIFSGCHTFFFSLEMFSFLFFSFKLPDSSASCSGPSLCITANGTRYREHTLIAAQTLSLTVFMCFLRLS